MRFSYFLLADAANTTADRKVNMLGAGVRIVNARELPVIASLAIVGALEGPIEQAGSYPLTVTIDSTDGKVIPVIESSDVRFGSDLVDPLLPIGASFQISIPFRFDEPGIRTIKARFGRARAEWRFAVRLVEADGTELISEIDS